MLGTNIASLRKRNGLTQEEVAEQLNVSRQTLAKWERGEGEPDMRSCMLLAKLFDVSLDDLVSYEATGETDDLGIGPKGKHFFGAVTVGERGQIVIPQKARKIFDIHAGDQLMIFGDEERGLAIVPKRGILEMMSMLFGGKNKDTEE